MADAPCPPAHYDDLRALFLNCTLKPTGMDSHTGRLIHVALVMRASAVVPVRRGLVIGSAMAR